MGCLGVWFFFHFLCSPKAHSKTGWPWPHSNPFACLTNARIADANHHAWHCFLLSPYFNCKWLFIFLRCIYPLVFKSWGKWLCGPLSCCSMVLSTWLLPHGSPWILGHQPSYLYCFQWKGREDSHSPAPLRTCFRSTHSISADLHLGFHPGADSHQERGKGENAWFKIHTFCFRRGWENRPWGSAWRSLRLACFRVCQVSRARKLHS